MSDLPKINPIVAAALTRMVMKHPGILRDPKCAAAVLALIVEIHREAASAWHEQPV